MMKRMTMADAAGDSMLQRITLAVDASGYSLTNIELAVNMAMTFNAQLHGLFIEDVDLLQIADLPFSKEITLLTAQERQLDVLSLQRSLRIKSLEFRKRLAVTAESSKVQWSFDSVRGKKTEAGRGGDEVPGLIIIGQALTRSRLPARLEGPKRIILFYDEMAGLSQVLEAVINLSKEQRIELLLVGADKNNSKSIQQALDKTREQDLNLDRLYLDEYELFQLLKEKKSSIDYVIASKNQSSDVLRWMIENSVCPAIILS